MEGTNLYQQRYNCIEETMKQSFISLKRGNSFKMIKTEEGFSLVELLVTMVVFVLILTATSNTFIDLLKDFKKQSSQAETNIEGAVGLETFRRDIASAGYGLPWAVTGDVTTWAAITGYTEGANSGTPNPSTYNDGNAGTGTEGSAPRAIVSGNNITTYTGVNAIFNGSDYLVIKAVNVATNATAQKWTHLRAGANQKTTWVPDCENVNKDTACATKNTVRVIVINPGGTGTSQRALVVAGGAFFAQYNNAGTSTTDPFAPAAGSTDVYVIYGVDDDTNLRMPFNRADYFIERPSDISSSCADNTGVLYKGVVSQTDGTIPSASKIPILDCVADMQVVFRRDTGTDGIIDTASEDISTLDAATIRDTVKEVRVYILAHEGQKDMSYTSQATIRVGDTSLDGISVGRDFGITTANRNYRWKLYTLVVKMENLK